MNDPQVVKFLNEHIRTRAEMIRALNALIEDDINNYNTVIKDLIVEKSVNEVIEDGRTLEGVSRITGQDAIDFMNILTKMRDILQELGSQDVIRKPCVRSLEITIKS